MIIYKGGNTVGKGTYWDFASGRRVDVVNEVVLAGNNGAQYIRMSPTVMLLTGPLTGLVYALCMPVISIAAVAVLAVRTVVSGAYNLAAKTISFGWRPGNAYLSGKKKKKI